MTDEQIVKALENITSEKIGDCKRDCAFYDGKVHSCGQTIALHALDLIKRQQEEIESLEADYENVYKQAAADLLASIADGGTSCEWCIDKHRAEAVREFAKRLKEKATSTFYEERKYVDTEDIDNLVKEMTEKEGGKG